MAQNAKHKGGKRKNTKKKKKKKKSNPLKVEKLWENLHGVWPTILGAYVWTPGFPIFYCKYCVSLPSTNLLFCFDFSIIMLVNIEFNYIITRLTYNQFEIKVKIKKKKLCNNNSVRRQNTSLMTPISDPIIYVLIIYTQIIWWQNNELPLSEWQLYPFY